MVRAYLELTDGTNRRIEFTDGRLEFLPMPTEVHEAIVRFLFLALYRSSIRRKLGEVYSNGIRLRIRPRKVRLPDIIFLHKDHFHARHNRVWDGADLVMEVVSDDPKDHARDYQEKLADYAEAKIAEYWIIDPERQLVIVHRLDGDAYAIDGEFSRGEQATSDLLNGFTIDVEALFAVADKYSGIGYGWLSAPISTRRLLVVKLLRKQQRPLHLHDRVGEVDAFGAGGDAVELGVAAPDAVVVVEDFEAVVDVAVARVEEAEHRLVDRGRAEVRLVAAGDAADAVAGAAGDAVAF